MEWDKDKIDPKEEDEDSNDEDVASDAFENADKNMVGEHVSIPVGNDSSGTEAVVNNGNRESQHGFPYYLTQMYDILRIVSRRTRQSVVYLNVEVLEGDLFFDSRTL